MNSLLDRLSIVAAVLVAAAAVADFSSDARIVPNADGLEIVIDVRLGGGAPGLLGRLIARLPAPRIAAACEELDA